MGRLDKLNKFLYGLPGKSIEFILGLRDKSVDFILGLLGTSIKFMLGLRTNYEPEKIIEEALPLLRKAKSTIQIVAGQLDPGFYTVPSILKVIEDSKATVEIIHGPNPNKESKNKLNEITPNGKVKFYELEKDPEGHFMVIDTRHARVEDRHNTGQPAKRGFIKYNCLFLAGRLSEEFDRLRAEAPHAEAPNK